jgi:antitoxin VapB
MAPNIEDPATEKSVREWTMITGETVTTAVRRAAEERRQRLRRQRSAPRLAEELMAIGKRCAALPDLDQREAAAILGYDEHGPPR